MGIWAFTEEDGKVLEGFRGMEQQVLLMLQHHYSAAMLRIASGSQGGGRKARVKANVIT